MSPLTIHRSATPNAFAELEARLRSIDASGDRIAEATSSLRASVSIFAAAAARMRATRSARRAGRNA